MKKALCVLAVLMLLTACVPAFAATVHPGETATVTIRVTTAGAWARVGINYDSSVLEFVTASGGSVAPSGGSGSFVFGSGTSPIGTASGSVTFRVKSTAPAGTYSVTGSVKECYNTDETSASCSVTGGSITVVTGTDPNTPVPGPNTPVPGPNTPKPTRRPTATPQPDLGTYEVTVEENGEQTVKMAKMLCWGLAKSEVMIDGVKTTVNTRDITLSDTVSIDHQLAMIYAPNQGKAALRKAASAGSKQILSAESGIIVYVIDIEGGFTKVNYLGREGYVKNTSLKYFGACEELGTGTVKNTNGNTVPVYVNRDRASWKELKLQAGTKVTVIQAYSEWYAIDVNGYHGYILKKNLVMD